MNTTYLAINTLPIDSVLNRLNPDLTVNKEKAFQCIFTDNHKNKDRKQSAILTNTNRYNCYSCIDKPLSCFDLVNQYFNHISHIDTIQWFKENFNITNTFVSDKIIMNENSKIQHTQIKKLNTFQYRYFVDHGIKAVNLYSDYNIGVSTLTSGQYNNHSSIVIPLPNGSYKYFIMDNDCNVIEKRTNKGGVNCIYPHIKADNKKDTVFICEGFADLIKLRELGYNAFTTSGGVSEIFKLAKHFKNRTVYICIDNDSQSKKFLSIIDKFFVQNNNKVFNLNLSTSNEKDICDYFLSNSSEDFTELINKSIEYVNTEKENISINEIEQWIKNNDKDIDNWKFLEELKSNYKLLLESNIVNDVTITRNRIVDWCKGNDKLKIAKYKTEKVLKETEKEVRKKNKTDTHKVSMEERVEDIIDSLSDRTIIYINNDGFYEYIEGYYQKKSNMYITKLAFDYLEGINSLDRNNSRLMNNFLKAYQTKNLKDIVLNSDKTKVNLINGLYDLIDHKFIEHTPTFYSTIRLPVNYNKGAKSERWDRFINEITNSRQDISNVLQEMFGYCMTPDNTHEKAFWLHGEGANGKSTFLNILNSVIGQENISSVSMPDFDKPFERVSIHNKLVNISYEMSSKSLESNIFKSIVSGDRIDAQYKFKDSFSFYPYCKLIFAMNDLPYIKDDTQALYRRLVIIPFTITFDETQKDINLKAELLESLDAIFNWGIEGLKRLQCNKKFTESVLIDYEINKYKYESNSVYNFVYENCIIAKDIRHNLVNYKKYVSTGNSNKCVFVEKDSFYDSYKGFCNDKNFIPCSIRVFGKRLLSLNMGIVSKRRQLRNNIDNSIDSSWFYVGISLLPNSMNEFDLYYSPKLALEDSFDQIEKDTPF